LEILLLRGRSGFVADFEVALSGVVEEEVDFLLGYFAHGLVFPLGRAVLVDKKRANTFEELGVVHETLRDTVLHLKDFFDAHRRAALDLFEHDGDGKRTHLSDELFGLSGEFAVRLSKSLHDGLGRVRLKDFSDFGVVVHGFAGQ